MARWSTTTTNASLAQLQRWRGGGELEHRLYLSMIGMTSGSEGGGGDGEAVCASNQTMALWWQRASAAEVDGGGMALWFRSGAARG